MTEPLNETPRLNAKELFTKAAVERFQEKVSDIERSDLRHYNQLITHFDDKAIHAALSKFQVPIEARVTVYGGFAGQFAEFLRRIGMRVIFTDAMVEWVEQTRRMGFESFKVSAQEMPKELV